MIVRQALELFIIRHPRQFSTAAATDLDIAFYFGFCEYVTLLRAGALIPETIEGCVKNVRTSVRSSTTMCLMFLVSFISAGNSCWENEGISPESAPMGGTFR